MQFTDEQVGAILRSLSAPRSETGGGRFAALHEAIRLHEAHFFNTKEADQHLPAPHDKSEPFQTDLLRRTWVAVKARVTENPFRVRAVPAGTKPAQQQASDEFEEAINRGLDLVQERAGFSIQGDLADGQVIDCFGVLHWRMAHEVWPQFPERLESDEPGDGYRETRDEDGTPRRYVETEPARQDRDRRAKARAGFPWHVEVLHPGTVAFVRDISSENGMGMFVVQREVPLLEYSIQLQRQDNLYVSLNDASRTIRVYQERDRPATWEPSYGSRGYERTVVVSTLWTRDECYEVVSTGAGGALAVVKSFTHPYTMPPFALALADYVNVPDPALAYMPALKGGYRVKSFYDRDVSLGRAIAEQIALPFYYVKLASGEYMQDAAGKQIVFTRNALAAQALPPGAEIVAIAPELNAAVIEFLRLTGEELKESMPTAGQIEIGASTQPWTIRMAQEEANVPIARLKAAQASAIRTMVRNMQHCMVLPAERGGFGQPIPVAMEDGTIRTIEPEKVADLTLEVDISPSSNAQRVAKVEQGRALLGDPNVPYTTREFVERDLEKEDVSGYIEEWYAEQFWTQYVAPGFIRQKVAEHFGATYVVDPSGQAVDSQGMPQPPEAVLGAKGYRVQQPPIAPTVVAAGAPTVPSLPALAPNGMVPMPGLPGTAV